MTLRFIDISPSLPATLRFQWTTLVQSWQKPSLHSAILQTRNSCTKSSSYLADTGKP